MHLDALFEAIFLKVFQTAIEEKKLKVIVGTIWSTLWEETATVDVDKKLMSCEELFMKTLFASDTF